MPDGDAGLGGEGGPDLEVMEGGLEVGSEQDQQGRAVLDAGVSGELLEVAPDGALEGVFVGRVGLEFAELSDDLDLDPEGVAPGDGGLGGEEAELRLLGGQGSIVGGDDEIAASPFGAASLAPVARVPLLGEDAVARGPQGAVEEGVEGQLLERIDAPDGLLEVNLGADLHQPCVERVEDRGQGPAGSHGPRVALVAGHAPGGASSSARGRRGRKRSMTGGWTLEQWLEGFSRTLDGYVRQAVQTAEQAAPEGDAAWSELRARSQVAPDPLLARWIASLHPTARGASAEELRQVLERLVGWARGELHRLQQQAPAAASHPAWRSLQERLDRLALDEVARYRERRAGAALGQPAQQPSVGGIFANAARTADQTPWAEVYRQGAQAHSLVCKHCGSAQERTLDFQCRYCKKSLALAASL